MAKRFILNTMTLRHYSKRNILRIYQSWLHLGVTLLFIVVPFLFLLIFSRAIDIPASQLLADVFVSFLRIAIAYAVAASLGWLVAVSFYRGKRAIIALPLFDVLQSFPTFAALPIAVFLWGPSNVTIIFFLILTMIWPIFFSVLGSLKLVKRDWEEMVEVADLRGILYLRHFLLPLSIPGLITGSIIGLGEGWEALVATEIIVRAKTGLGGFFQFFSQDVTVTAFGILGFLLLIFSVNKLIWLPLLEWGHRRMEE